MHTKIYNYYNIDIDSISRKVIRAKALLINSNKEILLGYSHDTYQFIGGHIEEEEDLVKGLIREIEEESGIIIDDEEVIPFLKVTKYVKDYPNINENSCYDYYYYYIKTDKLPNLELVNYTDNEKEGNFKLVYIPLDEVEEVFKDNQKVSERVKTIALENLEAMEYFKKSSFSHEI